jgi:hypothetical protein
MSVRVLSWVFDHSPVEHRGDLLVLLVLADHAHDDGTRAFPSVETIARKARLSRRGAQLALRRLERVGAIKETASEGPRRPRSYSVIMGEPTSPRTDCTGEVADTEGRTESHVGAKGSSPEPSVEPSVEPSPSLKRSEGRERARSPVRSKEHRRAPEAVGMTERCSVCSMLLVHANGKLICPRPACPGHASFYGATLRHRQVPFPSPMEEVSPRMAENG